MVTWFAGVFFLGRMLIYARDAIDQNEQSVLDNALLGAKRVWYIITLPSMILTVIFGVLIAFYIQAFTQPWMQLKLCFVVLFVIYNIYLNYLRLSYNKRKPWLSSYVLRLLNEVPFIFLVIILAIVYLKSLMAAFVALGIVVGFAVIVMVGLKLFR
tara:strand:+ start:543 stop:1010 length:468 start_codon:yes stop_codon:yes gene_type:complete